MNKDLQEYLDLWCERYLSYRPRTEFEMRRYIKKRLMKKRVKDPDEQEKYIEDKIERLKEAGDVDDDKFVRWYVKEKTYFKPRGKIRLKHDLMRLGVKSEVIDGALEETVIDEEVMIQQLLETKYSKVELNDKDSRNKLIQKLMRRGFSYANISSALKSD